MSAVVLEPRVLVCPNACGVRAPDLRVGDAPVGGGAARLHNCRVLFGLSVPLVPEGTQAEARAVERQDYVGAEVGLRYVEDGRPIMAVEVVRDEGNDAVVFPGVATGGA